MLYTTDEPLVAMAKILSQPMLVSLYLANPSFLLCGIAYSFHNSVNHCVVLVFADQAREDSRQLMKLLVEPTPAPPAKNDSHDRSTTSIGARFIPADTQGSAYVR